MDELHCYESLESTEEKLLSEGLEEQAAVNRQVWNSVMGLMDEMVALFGDSEERLGAKRAVSIFRAGLEEALLSPLPPKAGSMMCGGVGDIADGDYDVVFLAGLTDATLQVAPDPFVDDDERRALNEQTRRFVGLDDAGRDRKMKLDLYAALCMPTRRLYVSMVNTEQNGETRRPHLFYQELRYMFPACAETGGVLRRSLSDRPLSLTHAAAEYASRFASDQVNEVWQSAWRRICREVPETAARVQSVFVRSRDRGTVSREASAGLFRENVMSVSRLETFAACPFRHFVRYGLRPDEPRGWRVNPADTGSFYHEALDGITKLLPSIPNWPDVRKRECDALVDQVAAEYEEKIYGPLMQDSFRARAAVQDYRRLLKRVLWSFTKGACNSAFRIMGSELHFGDGTDGALPAVPLQLPDGQRVMLRGVIDRVDRYDSETGESYYRVVDYKSGDQSLEARRIYYGEQLQLLMYLRAVSGADGIPAGAYYYHLEDSLVEEPEDPAMLEQLLAETLKLKGITLRDAKIIRLMDGGKPPVSMPQLLNKDGSIAKKSSTFLLNEMYELMRFAVQKAVSLCEDMRRGSVRPRQVVGTGRSACETCDYADICRRENRRQVAEEKMTMQDLIELAAEPQE